jgi:hypothetical protein
MPPVTPVEFADLSPTDQRAALERLFGTSGFGQVAVAIALGESDGDLIPE